MLTKFQLLQNKFYKALLFSAITLFSFKNCVFAQTQFAGWGATFQNYKLSSWLGVYFDAQWRSTDQLKQMHALLLRPGLNLYFTPSLTGTVGYAFIPQQRIASGVTGYLPEQRVWEQMTYTHPVKAGHTVAGLTHRLRLEQRYLPKHHAESGKLVHDGYRHAGRLRYFTRGIIPLGSGSARTAANRSGAASADTKSSAAFTKGWFAAVQNEIFFNLGNVAALNGKTFDQNRAYVAAGYRLCKQFDVEMGYMNQYIAGAGTASTNNHIVQFATYVRL